MQQKQEDAVGKSCLYIYKISLHLNKNSNKEHKIIIKSKCLNIEHIELGLSSLLFTDSVSIHHQPSSEILTLRSIFKNTAD